MVANPLYTQDLTSFEATPSDPDDPKDLAQAVGEVCCDPHPLLKQIQGPQDFTEIEGGARALAGFKTVVIFGTGGSSLGAKSLVALQQSFSNPSQTGTPALHFMDNVDPHTLQHLFATLNSQETGFLVVSKSGSTAETLAQFLAALSFMKPHFSKEDLRRHFLILTEPTASPLRKLAQDYGFETLDHPTDIGGRFSVFTVVGLVPALVAGLSPAEVIAGAQEVWTTFQHEGSKAAPAQGAMACVRRAKRGASTTVLMPYCDRLLTLAAWHRQLWAESLGKAGQGTLPAPALGTVDQHSQLQLYLEGPKDKLFTLLAVSESETSAESVSSMLTFDKEDLMCDSRLSYLNGKSIEDLMIAEYKATAQTLVNHGCPVRLMTVGDLTPKSLGALMMHFVLETMVAARLMNINAFDQPAVEESKRLTKLYLQETSANQKSETKGPGPEDGALSYNPLSNPNTLATWRPSAPETRELVS